jgi:hypothetical protein
MPCRSNQRYEGSYCLRLNGRTVRYSWKWVAVCFPRLLSSLIDSLRTPILVFSLPYISSSFSLDLLCYPQNDGRVFFPRNVDTFSSKRTAVHHRPEFCLVTTIKLKISSRSIMKPLDQVTAVIKEPLSYCLKF